MIEKVWIARLETQKSEVQVPSIVPKQKLFIDFDFHGHHQPSFPNFSIFFWIDHYLDASSNARSHREMCELTPKCAALKTTND